MGYPMSYKRVVARNQLRESGALVGLPDSVSRAALTSDLRRLEADSRDEAHLRAYALVAGITPEGE